MRLNPHLFIAGSSHVIRVIINAGERGDFSYRLLQDAFLFMEQNHYNLAGNVIGNFLARVHENGHYARYIEIWIPVLPK